MSAPTAPPALRPPAPGREALDFDAPYVVEKLVKNCTAENEQEAQLLLREVQRYIVLVQADPTTAWPMFSLRVDEAWHQFILFTAEYAEFCHRFFGRFVHHAPSNSPSSGTAKKQRPATFTEFADRYRALYTTELPTVWHDDRTVTLDRRLINQSAGSLTASDSLDRVELVRPDGTVAFRANAVARDALAFIARTGAFHVREIPGDLTDEERVALAATLVTARVLRAGA